ncbi:MAG: hypothetical protein BGO74_03670 [Burkholderiales bacterium 68-12]|nr:MAG: hypothetical protein BGO74_03670 [Burkholderiales bacterium 68-12]
MTKENTMQNARILAIAALSAFATLGAQAAELNGNLYGTDFEAKVQSVRNRTDVRAEGQRALPQFARGPVADHAAAAASTQERPAVRNEGAVAARAHRIALGELS